MAKTHGKAFSHLKMQWHSTFSNRRARGSPKLHFHNRAKRITRKNWLTLRTKTITREKLKEQPRSPARALTVSQESRNLLGLFRYLSSVYVFANPRFLSIKRHNLFGFSCIKNMLRDQLFKTSGLQFDNSLFGPKTFLGPTNMSQGQRTELVLSHGIEISD